MKLSIQQAERFVAMMGIEPIQSALNAGAQVVICRTLQRCGHLCRVAGARGDSQAHRFFTPEKILELRFGGRLRQRFLIRIAWRRNWIRNGFTIRSAESPPFAAHHKAFAAHKLV